MIKNLILFLLLTALAVQKSYAQKIFFRNYTVTDGLCANTVWDIEQDAQGFMWFGTKYGLNRFDGHEFKSYQFDKKNNKSIGNNFIHKIFRYDAETFWIGTEKGIYIFDLTKEVFTLFKPLDKIFANDIFRDSKNNIWIATKANGVYKYQPQKKHLTNYIASSTKPGLSSNEISKIIEDKDGQIWIGTYGKGIDVLNPSTNTLINYHNQNTAGTLSNNFILSLFKDLENNIWVGTMSGGLNCFSPKSHSFKAYTKSGDSGISDNIVRDIYQYEAGEIYFATEKGLNIFNTRTGIFKSYQSRNDDLYSISDDAVYTVYRDREGGFWLGTYFGGLNYYNEKFSNLEYYYPSGAANSLVGSAVSAFQKTDDHHIWVGTEDAGLNIFNTLDKTFKRYPFAPNQEKLSYHNIHALFLDKQQNIWVGMYTAGLNILNPKTGKIKRYKSNPNNPNTLSDNSVYSIDEDREGRIWVSTISGLNLYNPKQDNFTRVKDKYLEKSCIYQVYQDKNKTLWMATYDNGLVKMDPSGHTTRFIMNSSPNSITSNKVISILDDGKGNLWLGTDGGGLNVFNIETQKFTDYNEKFGIESDVIYGVVKQNDHKFWMSTSKGIYELDLQNKSNKNFNKWDNLQSQQYNYKAFFKDNNGKIYFGGIRGFNAFNPNTIQHASQKAPIVFTNFQIFNKDLNIGDGSSPLKQTINFTDEVVLKHTQSVISIEYAQLSFIAPNKTQYAFKMEGFDKDWNKVGGQQKATYTNLPAGNYKFLVTELNTATPYENPYSIKIEILPPFYKSKLAYFLYIILLAVFTYLLSRFFLQKTKRRNEIKLERLKNINEKEFYKQKIEFFTVMAHEIRTPLSLIIAPLEKMLGKKQVDEENTAQLQLMEENSDRLLTLVNQLLDFRRIESDIYTIRLEKVDLVSLIKSICDKFSAMTYQKGVSFTVSCKRKAIYAMLDPEAINKIVSNLLINASKFARERVTIFIDVNDTLADGQKLINLSVEDDGIGIPPSEIGSIFTKFFKVQTEDHNYNNLGGSGIGLALVKSLVEKHKGTLQVESEQNVRTAFIVNIPFIEETGNISSTIEQSIGEPEDGQQTILVVEDDQSLLNFISENYESDGYFVLKAQNGVIALQLLERHQVDMVISDVMMPEMDGIELCKHIKNDMAFSHLPVVLLTAKTNSDAVTEGLENGADAYLSKPFKWKNLSLITKNLMELRQNLKQRFSQSPFETFEILPAGAKDKDFLNKLIESIEDRIADPLLSVEELGREIGLSRSTLYKKIKSMTGYVPNEFIRVIRLKNAAKLLVAKNYNISEIGYMVGFSSPSYFSKCFYQQFKLTPTEFSEQNKVIAT